MQNIRVAAVSMNSELGRPDRALDAIAHWCEKAKAEQAELALFPKLVVRLPGRCAWRGRGLR